MRNSHQYLALHRIVEPYITSMNRPHGLLTIARIRLPKPRMDFRGNLVDQRFGRGNIDQHSGIILLENLGDSMETDKSFTSTCWRHDKYTVVLIQFIKDITLPLIWLK